MFTYRPVTSTLYLPCLASLLGVNIHGPIQYHSVYVGTSKSPFVNKLVSPDTPYNETNNVNKHNIILTQPSITQICKNSKKKLFMDCFDIFVHICR